MGVATGPDVSGWRWDVALSFASAQRGYVEQVAARLKAAGVHCFYDADEQTDLWGRYLTEELPTIYAEQAGAVVVFVSADYATRDWTRLERRRVRPRGPHPCERKGVLMRRSKLAEFIGTVIWVAYLVVIISIFDSRDISFGEWILVAGSVGVVAILAAWAAAVIAKGRKSR
jgi:hypothetical protein